MEKRTYKGKEYIAYTKQEARDKGIRYVHWKKVKPGGWALSDDDMVFKCIRRIGPWGARKEYKFIFPNGPHFSRTKFCKWSEPREPRSEGKRELSRRGARPALRAYARLLVNGDSITEEQYQTLGRIFRQDQKNPAASFMRLIKYQEAQEVIAEELEGLLSGKGVTPGKVIDDYLTIQEQAKEIGEKNENVAALSLAKSINDQFSKMLDMRPQKQVRQLETAEQIDWDSLPDFEPRELGEIEIDD